MLYVPNTRLPIRNIQPTIHNLHIHHDSKMTNTSSSTATTSATHATATVMQGRHFLKISTLFALVAAFAWSQVYYRSGEQMFSQRQLPRTGGSLATALQAQQRARHYCYQYEALCMGLNRRDSRVARSCSTCKSWCRQCYSQDSGCRSAYNNCNWKLSQMPQLSTRPALPRNNAQIGNFYMYAHPGAAGPKEGLATKLKRKVVDSIKMMIDEIDFRLMYLRGAI